MFVVFRDDVNEPDAAPSPATDVVSRMELLEVRAEASYSELSTTVDLPSSSSAVGRKTSSNPAAVDELLHALQKFSQFLGKLRYDAANEVLVSFRNKRKRHRSGTSKSVCEVFVSACLSLSGLEQLYYSFNFIRAKGQARKDADLLTLYEQTRARISSLPTDCDPNFPPPWSSDFQNLFVEFINARVTLIKVYDKLIALADWDQKNNLHQFLMDLMHYEQYLGDQQEHCYLSQFVNLLYTEIRILRVLLNVQLLLMEGQYLSSLSHLKFANEKIRTWFNSIDYGKLRSRSSSFLRLGISKGQSNYLCGFIDQFYSILFAKFSLYFYNNISSYCLKADFEQALNDIGQPNFFQLFSTFCRKHDASHVTFVSSVHTFGGPANERKQEFHKSIFTPACNEKIRFKLLYSLGADRKQLLGLLPIALDVIIGNDLSNKKIVAVHNRSTVHSYLVSLVEASVYMVMITNKNIKGNDGKYIIFMTDICRTLTFAKLCHSLIG